MKRKLRSRRYIIADSYEIYLKYCEKEDINPNNSIFIRVAQQIISAERNKNIVAVNSPKIMREIFSIRPAGYFHINYVEI